jgi:hypothetical protein
MGTIQRAAVAAARDTALRGRLTVRSLLNLLVEFSRRMGKCAN